MLTTSVAAGNRWSSDINTANVAENTTAVKTVTATDADDERSPRVVIVNDTASYA
jgi:hypothetical protein